MVKIQKIIACAVVAASASTTLLAGKAKSERGVVRGDQDGLEVGRRYMAPETLREWTGHRDTSLIEKRDQERTYMPMSNVVRSMGLGRLPSLRLKRQKREPVQAHKIISRRHPTRMVNSELLRLLTQEDRDRLDKPIKLYDMEGKVWGKLTNRKNEEDQVVSVVKRKTKHHSSMKYILDKTPIQEGYIGIYIYDDSFKKVRLQVMKDDEVSGGEHHEEKDENNEQDSRSAQNVEIDDKKSDESANPSMEDVQYEYYDDDEVVDNQREASSQELTYDADIYSNATNVERIDDGQTTDFYSDAYGSDTYRYDQASDHDSNRYEYTYGSDAYGSDQAYDGDYSDAYRDESDYY